MATGNLLKGIEHIEVRIKKYGLGVRAAEEWVDITHAIYMSYTSKDEMVVAARLIEFNNNISKRKHGVRILLPQPSAITTSAKELRNTTVMSRVGENILIKSNYRTPLDIIKTMEENYTITSKIVDGKISYNQIHGKKLLNTKLVNSDMSNKSLGIKSIVPTHEQMETYPEATHKFGLLTISRTATQTEQYINLDGPVDLLKDIVKIVRQNTFLGPVKIDGISGLNYTLGFSDDLLKLGIIDRDMSNIDIEFKRVQKSMVVHKKNGIESLKDLPYKHYDVGFISYSGENSFLLPWSEMIYSNHTLGVFKLPLQEDHIIYNFRDIVDIGEVQITDNLYISTLFSTTIKNHEKIPDKRFYILLLTIIFSSKSMHANSIIIDTYKKTLRRYEPHGLCSGFSKYKHYNVDNEIKIAMNKLEFLKDYTYISPRDYQVIVGVQTKECNLRLPVTSGFDIFTNERRDQSSGFCMAWAMLYMHHVLNNYKDRDATKIAIDFVKTNDSDLATMIRNYMEFLVGLRLEYEKK
jgi:hypothetical protein